MGKKGKIQVNQLGDPDQCSRQGADRPARALRRAVHRPRHHGANELHGQVRGRSLPDLGPDAVPQLGGRCGRQGARDPARERHGRDLAARWRLWPAHQPRLRGRGRAGGQAGRGPGAGDVDARRRPAARLLPAHGDPRDRGQPGRGRLSRGLAARMSTPGINATIAPETTEDEIGVQESNGASDMLYRVPNRSLEYTYQASGVPRGWWRGVHTTHTIFAVGELHRRAGRESGQGSVRVPHAPHRCAAE